MFAVVACEKPSPPRTAASKRLAPTGLAACDRAQAAWARDGWSGRALSDKVEECVIAHARDGASGAPTTSEARDACIDETTFADVTVCMQVAGATADQIGKAKPVWTKRRADAERAREETKKETEDAERREAEKRAKEKERASWVGSIGVRCAGDLNAKVCGEAPALASADDLAACSAKCRKSIDDAIATTFGSAEAACVRAFVAAGGKGKFACDVSLPADADLRGDALKGRTDACAASCAKNGPPALVAEREAAAKRAAREREVARAEKEAPDLVRGFHKCMIAFDSTPTARKYQAYDRPMYVDYMQQAMDTCWAQYKCAWVEEYTDAECRYAI